MTIQWVQISARISRPQAEALEDSMMAAGAASVTMQDAQDQPILEPAIGETPLWDQTIVIGLFDASEDLKQAEEIIHEVYALQTESDSETLQLKTSVLENEDWTRKWMENFKPIQFGKRLWICPSWEPIPDPEAVNVLLDPGLAFGTGTHPTTALCLTWLDSLDLKGKTIVDYGCGSGILAIAAIKLGAQKAICIDNDPQALIATQENAKRNGISDDSIETFLPQDKPNIKTDIVIANILAQPLVDLSQDILSHLRPNGKIGLSGILSSQNETLRQHYADKVSLADTQILNDWCLLNGEKIGD